MRQKNEDPKYSRSKLLFFFLLFIVTARILNLSKRASLRRSCDRKRGTLGASTLRFDIRVSEIELISEMRRENGSFQRAQASRACSREIAFIAIRALLEVFWAVIIRSDYLTSGTFYDEQWRSRAPADKPVQFSSWARNYRPARLKLRCARDSGSPVSARFFLSTI